MRCNWVRRVLFLADRKELVTQARNEMAKHLPDVPPVNLLTEKSTEGRVYVSTYPTMMNMIADAKGGERRRLREGYRQRLKAGTCHRGASPTLAWPCRAWASRPCLA